MKNIIYIFIAIAPLYKEVFCQNDTLFNWIFPMDNCVIFREITDGESTAKSYYVSNASGTTEIDLHGMTLSKKSVPIQKLLYGPLGGPKYGVHSSSQGTKIVDLITFEEFSIPYNQIQHEGGSFFSGKNNYSDIIYLINIRDPNFQFTVDNSDTYHTIEAGTDFFIVGDPNRDIFTVYDQSGELMFQKKDHYITIISEEKGIFLLKNTATDKHYVANKKGLNIFDDFDQNSSYIRTNDIKEGIRLETADSKPIYLTYNGQYLQNPVEISTHDININTIENCANSKMAIRFKSTNKVTECKYDKITVATNSITYGNREAVIAKINDGEDYYGLDGDLIFQSQNHQFVRYLKNKYFLIGMNGKCGIMNNESVLKVPAIYQQRNHIFADACWGSTTKYEGRDYFVINNGIGHAFIYEDDDLILSFRDDHYGDKLGWIGDNLIISKGRNSLGVGLVSLKTKELILPFEYKHIYSNTFKENESSEYAILSKRARQADYSLYHIPSRQFLLTEFDSMTFLSGKLIRCTKQGRHGIIRLVK